VCWLKFNTTKNSNNFIYIAYWMYFLIFKMVSHAFRIRLKMTNFKFDLLTTLNEENNWRWFFIWDNTQFELLNRVHYHKERYDLGYSFSGTTSFSDGKKSQLAFQVKSNHLYFLWSSTFPGESFPGQGEIIASFQAKWGCGNKVVPCKIINKIMYNNTINNQNRFFQVLSPCIDRVYMT